MTCSGPLHQPRGIKLCHSPLGLPFSWYVRKEFTCCRSPLQPPEQSPCVHFAREQRARMIAVSFKCRCQILRRLTKGTVLFLLLHRASASAAQNHSRMAVTFKYDCLLQFIVGQQRTQRNMYRSLCIGGFPRSVLVYPGWVHAEIGGGGGSLCDFFFF